MIKEQKISSLIESCGRALKEQGYSDFNIEKHHWIWKKISEYMKEHSIISYSADVGNKYLETLSPDYHISYLRSFRRSIFLLTDYQSCGKIRARITQCVTHELSGEVGKVAKNLITSLKEKRYKATTLEGYKRVLSYFIRHLSSSSIYEPSQISEKEILSFISSTQNCKPEKLIVIRAFCRYLYDQKIIEYDITYVIGKDSRPIQEKLPSVYEAKEVMQIEETIDRLSAVGKRDYAMLLLTTRLGLRASDVAGLQFENLDWEGNVIRLTQFKTKREIELPLLTEVGEAIIDYLKYSRPTFPSQQVFLTASKPYHPVNRWIINGAISRAIKSSKVCIHNRKFGPHAMRHTLASQLLYNGIPLPVISETLGHTDIQTTMGYLRIDFKGLMGCTLDVPTICEEFYQQKGGVFYE